MTSLAFGYAQTRMQARFGERAGGAAWEELRSIVELPVLLGRMRATALRHWIANISPITPSHEIERLMRARLRGLIGETAQWVPRQWRAAVQWCAALVDLPAIAHLMHNPETRMWAHDDTALRDLAASDLSARAAVLERGPLAPLSGPQDARLTDLWLVEWRRRWPETRAAERTQLETLIAHVRNRLHVGVGGNADVVVVSDREAADGPSLARGPRLDPIAEFADRLVNLFRHGVLSPSAVFAWLLLVAIESEQVRAALVTRAFFAPQAR